MKQIDLTPYNVTVKQRTPDGDIVDAEVPYDVPKSIIEILFARDQNLSGIELIRRDDIARKVLKAGNATHLVLEEADYKVLKSATEQVKGLSRNDVELVKRIFGALEYDPNATAGEA